jgi:hypothetical protein
MGAQTTVKTRNGSTYKGHTIGFSDEGDIAMSDVRLDNGDNTQKSCVPGIIIPKDKFVVCKTNGVDLKGLYSSPADFTDSGIVNRINGTSDTPMKVLQPWEDEDAVDINSSVTLDDPNERWDPTQMFQANRDKFNLRSTYNEDLPEYTTKLPDPHSEGYEEKEKFAQKQAEAIEQSEAYQSRISKELNDGDEEFLYSAVHRADEANLQPQRHQESNSNSGRNSCTIPSQKEDYEQSLRNEAFRAQGRGQLPPASHPQQSLHSHHQQQQQQIARQMNNQFQGPPPSVGPLNRNMGLTTQHPRQQGQPNHAGPHHPHHQQHPPHQYQQQPPPPHPGMQQHILPISQRHQQQRSSPHQQLVPLNQQSSKPHSTHLHLHNLPTTLSSSPSLSSLSQAQHPPPQKFNLHHKQSSTQQSPSIKGANTTGPLAPLPSPHETMRPVSLQTSLEFKNSENIDQKMLQRDRQQIYHQKPLITGPPPVSSHTGGQKVNDTQLPTSPSSIAMPDAQQIGQPGSCPTSSPQSALAPDRRVGRGMETSPEERNKIGQSLHDFKKNFVLESNGSNPQEPLRQEDTTEGSPVSSASSSSVATTPIVPAPETSLQPIEHTGEASAKHDRHEDASSQKSTLNPNAKEFKPKTQPVQVEAQSPSPQPRSSPHVPQMVHYPPQQTVLVPYSYFMANPQIKRATVSLGAGVMNDLAVNQVTGQPLLATQPPNMMYLQTAGQAMPTAYQIYSPQIINPRMVTPGSINMAQAGQMTGMEQMAAQNQPQPVFVTTQPQPLHTPIPAHLHPQPVHAQAIPLQSSIQQSQPVHMPNPVPSPVQHQQQNSQHMPQPHPHHMPQGPPHSSATPQPAHYPQINYSHGIPAVPRTSMSGQQSLTAGHSPVSYISASQFVYNSGAGQYTFAPALQPQATPNSSHGAGPQAQYVIMPQPNTQGHPPLQQHTAQPYTSSSIPFQPQQHLMQVPPHMPPNHSSNPSQSSPHMIHPGMSVGMHQQVSNTQSNMYMQVPSTAHQYQHQQ